MENESHHSFPSIICISEFENEARAFRLEWPRSKLLLVTDSAHIFKDLRLASDVRASLFIDGKVIKSAASSAAYYLLRLRHADSQEQQLQASHEFADYLLALIPLRLSFEEARARLFDLLDGAVPALSNGLKNSVQSLFDIRWSQKKRRVLRLIGVEQCNPAVDRIITNPVKLMEMLDGLPGVYVIAAPMGWGKTSKVVLPLFNKLKERGCMPVLAAPRRSHLYSYRNEPAHYENWWNGNGKGDDGLITVTNSLFLSGRFRLMRESSRAILFDEYELIRSHHAGKAVGSGSIIDRAGVFSAEELMVRSVLEERKGTVVYVDALMSDDTVSHIAKVAGKKVYLFQPETPLHNGKLFVHASRKKLVAQMRAMLKKNKNVAVISDIAHKDLTNDKLMALHLSCTEVVKEEKLLLDAGKFAELGDSDKLEELDSVLENYRLVTISPVLSTAASLTTSHFDAVFVIASGAMLPNELLQCFRRFRAVPDVHLSLPKVKNKECRSEAQLFYEEVAWMPSCDEVRFDSTDKIRKLPGVHSLLQRKLHEQDLRSDYCNTTLIMAESLGYRIVRVGCGKAASDGEEDETDTQVIVNESNAEQVALARKIGRPEAQKIRQGHTPLSEIARFELLAFDLREAYGTELSTQLVLDDCNGKLRSRAKVFNNLYTRDAVSEPLVFRLKIRILKKLCQFLRFDPHRVTFTPLPGKHPASEVGFFRTDVNEFLSWLVGGSLDVPGCDFTCLEAFEIAFPSMDPISMSPVTFAQKLMVNELGFKTERSSNRACLEGKDYWAYRIQQSDSQKKYIRLFFFR